MELQIKKTHELSNSEKQQICDLYAEVFKKVKLLDEFERQFAGTFLGYSYHVIINDQKRIVGSWSFVPCRYFYFGSVQTFVLSVDTMIAQHYRGKSGTLLAMADLSYKALKNDNISFILGFPNEKFYPITRKVIGWEHIGILDYYILPIRIGSILPSLTLFNAVSIWIAWVFNAFASDIKNITIKSTESDNGQIYKIADDEFIAYRYDEKYNVIKYRDSRFFVYRIYREEANQVAYILDFNPRQKEHLESIVKYIYEKEKDNIDIILYIGNLNYNPVNLIRVPDRFQPRQVNMCGKILLDDAVDERIFVLDNWHVNLSNYDVR